MQYPTPTETLPARQTYKCKNCGSTLRPANTPLPIPADNSIPIHTNPYTNNQGAHIMDFESGIACTNTQPLETPLAQLTALINDLKSLPQTNPADTDPTPLANMAKTNEQILALTNSIDEYIRMSREHVDQNIARLEEKLAETLAQLLPDHWNSLSNQIKESEERLLALLDKQTATQPQSTQPASPVEIDIDELADKLAAGVRTRNRRLDDENGSAVDALARVADELVKEQSANSTRLDRLAEEIRTAVANVEKLEEWRGILPVQVADEIGRTVEERVVGPISGALARQAPAILSELQDNKLIDIVSRSVREAQRPLLREILAGGRNGVPLWLFASTLLPLLLILGYLFIPGDTAMEETGRAMETIADGVARMETTGVPLRADTAERLQYIEEAVNNIKDEAMAHVRNSAALEEEIKSLKAVLAERNALINEYNETLQKQTRRLRTYEMRLSRLGVAPETVTED